MLLLYFSVFRFDHVALASFTRHSWHYIMYVVIKCVFKNIHTLKPAGD